VTFSCRGLDCARSRFARDLKAECPRPYFQNGGFLDAAPENSLNDSGSVWLMNAQMFMHRAGPPTEVKQAGDPCRAIEIVALTGQLYATGSTRLIATAGATQKVSDLHKAAEKSTHSGEFDVFGVPDGSIGGQCRTRGTLENCGDLPAREICRPGAFSVLIESEPRL
jgi:hypothetical protein